MIRQILVMIATFSLLSCYTENKINKQSETTDSIYVDSSVIAIFKQEFIVPSFKRDSNFNMTVGEYYLFLDAHNLNVKEIKNIEPNKKYTNSSIVIAVEPQPYTPLERGDSVMIYVRD